MRRKARRLAVQAIYSWQLSGNNVADIELNYLTENSTNGVDVEYFRELLSGVATQATRIDAALEPHLDRPIKDVDPIEKSLLRLGAYELMFRKDVPHKVVINEAIELAKVFGADDSHKFVNGALDKLAKA